MNTQSKLKIFKSGEYEYIYVYYKLGKNILRINTKNKVIKNSLTSDLLYKANIPDYKNLNKKTLRLKHDVDNYIRIKLKEHNPEISQKECEHFMKHDKDKIEVYFSDKPYSINELPKEKSVLDYYSDFYNFKLKLLNGREGIKHYKSLQNALTDYTTFISRPLMLADINSVDFLLDFRNFLTKAHPENYLTKGSLADNTIQKRIARFKSFLKYLESKNIYSFQNEIYDFEIKKYDNDIIALSKEDIKLILDLKITNKNWEKIIDVFVCNLFMGLRFGDLMSLKDYEFLMDSDGDYFLKKENRKTGVTVEIPIQKTSLDILKKYNFNLPKYTNQFFNRQLYDIFEYYNLFDDWVTKRRRVLTEIYDVRVKRRELITSHTCRRTFITLAISNNIPLNALMLASGHTQVATLKSYVKKVQNKGMFKAIDV